MSRIAGCDRPAILHLHRNLPWCDAGRLLPEILPDQCSVSRHRPDFQHFCRGRDRAPQEAVLGRTESWSYPLRSFFGVRKWFFDQMMELSQDDLGQLSASIYQSPWYRMLVPS